MAAQTKVSNPNCVGVSATERSRRDISGRRSKCSNVTRERCALHWPDLAVRANPASSCIEQFHVRHWELRPRLLPGSGTSAALELGALSAHMLSNILLIDRKQVSTHRQDQYALGNLYADWKALGLTVLSVCGLIVMRLRVKDCGWHTEAAKRQPNQISVVDEDRVLGPHARSMAAHGDQDRALHVCQESLMAAAISRRFLISHSKPSSLHSTTAHCSVSMSPPTPMRVWLRRPL